MKITIREDTSDDGSNTTWVAEVLNGATDIVVSVMDGTGVSVFADGRYIPVKRGKESDDEIQ